MATFDREMQKALEADGEKLRQLTGEDHGPYFSGYDTHDLYETDDPDAPDFIKDSNGEVVLGLCKNCGRAEIELEEPCGPPIQRKGK